MAVNGDSNLEAVEEFSMNEAVESAAAVVDGLSDWEAIKEAVS